MLFGKSGDPKNSFTAEGLPVEIEDEDKLGTLKKKLNNLAVGNSHYTDGRRAFDRDGFTDAARELLLEDPTITRELMTEFNQQHPRESTEE